MSDTPKTAEEQAAYDAEQAEKDRAAQEQAQAQIDSANRRQEGGQAEGQAGPADDPEARRAASRGAQVVLDPDSDAAVAARGGAGRTISENTAVRDADLAAQGLDPAAPSAEQTDRPDPAA